LTATTLSGKTLRRSEIETMFRLALPLIGVQVGMMFMGVVDTIMVGHLNASALAAVALGNLYFFALSIFVFGTLMALDPLVSQAVGARDSETVARSVQRGIVLACLLSVVTSGLLFAAAPLLRITRQPAELVPIAAAYAAASVPGTLPLFVFIVFRQTLQATGRVAPMIAAVIGANIVNAFLNWVMIFGHLGFPPLGAVGSAWASTISRWFMCILLITIVWKHLRALLVPVRPSSLQWGPLLQLLRLGAPIGFQAVLEFSAFAAVALLMGWLGPVQMAGHQVAINLASLTFMVPFGIAGAAAVLVGHAIGRADAPSARRAAADALVVGAAFMLLCGVVFLVFPSRLAGVYSTDLGVIAIAATLIPIAGVFQVFDGLQVVAAGILRGAGDTRAPLVVNLVGFWLIGMPISVYLGLRTPAGAEGLWWGLVAGLAAVAAFLLVRVRTRLKREIARLEIV
jgi:MATE family multidrug resistance protein